MAKYYCFIFHGYGYLQVSSDRGNFIFSDILKHEIDSDQENKCV
jgi:hypothetical protein